MTASQATRRKRLFGEPRSPEQGTLFCFTTTLGLFSEGRMLAQHRAAQGRENPENMRYLGIDFGETRIGVAVSDEAARMALPVCTIERRDDYSAIAELRALAREREVGGLVMGRPTHLDGRPGELAPRIHRFGRRLADACKLPLHFVDEALTSVQARSDLRTAGKKTVVRADIDAAAARVLLQDYLDAASRSKR